jgi:hypothetical protein
MKILPSSSCVVVKSGELETLWVNTGSGSMHDDDDDEEELWCDDFKSTVSFSSVSLL